MNKLIVAACAVALAVAAQAATFDWKTSGTGKLYNGTSSETYNGTAYLFSTADFTQQAILSAWDSGAFSADKALGTKTVKAGAIAGGTIDWGSAGDVLTAFIVVNDGDKIFISDTKSGAGTQATTVTLSYALKSGSQVDPIEFEKGAAKFSAQGWYKSTGGGVPEPTSGVLLLIGMAGLALRRKQK